MRKLVALTVIALIAAVGITYGATAGGSPTSFTDNLYGGGRFEAGCSDGPTPFCPALPRELSIGVISDTHNRIATGTLRYGIPGGGLLEMVGRVTCARLAGNQAVIGGVITESVRASDVGLQFSFVMQDNGSAGSAARDRVSPLFLHVPGVDPPADCSAIDTFGAGYFTLAAGDVAVEDH